MTMLVILSPNLTGGLAYNNNDIYTYKVYCLYIYIQNMKSHY